MAAVLAHVDTVVQAHLGRGRRRHPDDAPPPKGELEMVEDQQDVAGAIRTPAGIVSSDH